MGSGSSKDATTSSLPSSSMTVQRTRSKGARVFQSSCLGRSFGSYDCDNDQVSSDDRNKDHGSLSNGPSIVQTGTESNRGRDCSGKVKAQRQASNEVPCISSDNELDEWGQESTSRSVNGSNRVASSRSLNLSNRIWSRFRFIPGNISFRLNRTASLGSSSSYPLYSTSLRIANSEEGFHVHTGPTNNSVNRNEIYEGGHLLPACNADRPPAARHEDSGAIQLDSSASGSICLQDDDIISTRDVVENNENTRTGVGVNGRSLRNRAEIEGTETRQTDRRIGDREPVERSVRFSRALSVGRLRDRVLRRSSFSDGLFGHLQEDRGVRDSSQGSGRQVWNGVTRTSASEGNSETSTTSSNYPLPNTSSSIVTINNEVEPSRPRDTRYHDILEHRTDFLERRRRIRSQVRALQRLGSRFENLSGHERSCILAGQHRTGRCSCRTNGRTTNPDDDNSARASISRIVMLAEALFEVLDEIHQQSVVLSSRPSVSSIGSVPAPKEVVESIPVKIYMKSQKHLNEEAAQCYICLGEYEEGDSMRILPCHHEFHQTCIDKWLKEIHRVCPLCRGDVCRSN